MKKLFPLLLGMALLVPARAGTLVAFEDDFNGAAPAEISGGSITSVEGYDGIGGFSGGYYYNPSSTTTLSLAGLPAHDSVDVDFLLAVIDSWDGISGGCCNPDYFSVAIDGVTVLTASYTIFGNTDSPAGALLFSGGHVAVNGGWADQAYDMTALSELAVAHSASTLTVDFYVHGAGFQFGSDESFAIENVKVTVNTVDTGVPDVGATAGLFALSLGALAFFRRRQA